MSQNISPNNVLLIILDTVRAQSSYPKNPNLTPTIRDVGERGATFQQAIAPAPWTLPSHASIFTGLYPTEHCATSYDKKLGSSYKTLAQHLAEKGFKTGLFSSNAWLSDNHGLDQGFDCHSLSQSQYFKLFDEGIDFFRLNSSQDKEFFKIAAESIIRHPTPKNIANLIYILYKEFIRFKLNSGVYDLSPDWDAQTVAECKNFIQKNAGNNRFFAVVNLIQAHLPWRFSPKLLKLINVKPSKMASDEKWKEIAEKVGSSSQRELASGDIHFEGKDRSILTRLYESWIYSADESAGEIIELLYSENIRNDTLVIITSDHGECIARNGILGHAVTLHKDVTHVPLVIEGPNISETTIQDIVSIKDIFGTILSSLNIDSERPCLFEDKSQGIALTETNGLDTSDNNGQELAGKRRAIYTNEDCAEIRYDSDKTSGPVDLIEKLNHISKNMEGKSSKTSNCVEVRENIKSQLRHMGYM